MPAEMKRAAAWTVPPAIEALRQATRAARWAPADSCRWAGAEEALNAVASRCLTRIQVQGLGITQDDMDSDRFEEIHQALDHALTGTVAAGVGGRGSTRVFQGPSRKADLPLSRKQENNQPKRLATGGIRKLNPSRSNEERS